MRRVLDRLGSRNAPHAARTASIVLLSAAIFIVVRNALAILLFGRVEWDGDDLTTAHFVTGTVIVPVLCVVIGLSLRHRVAMRSPITGFVFAMMVVALVTGAIIALHDDSAGAQFFLVVPVIWSAFHLRTAGVVVVATSAAFGAAVITQFVTGEVTSGVVFITVAIVTAGVLILRDRRIADITEDLLEAQANTDALTGLSTRRVLDRVLADHMAEGSATPLTFLLIDIDNFKEINDRGGHLHGDAALRRVADRLTAIAGPDDVACRMGGDELALLLVGREVGEALRIAERFCADVREMVILGDGVDRSFRLTLSIGVAHAPEDADDLRSLYEVADRRLYRAKERGRAQLVATDVVGA